MLGIRGAINQSVTNAILHLLWMIREALGPLLETYRAMIEHEIEQFDAEIECGSIVTYEKLARQLSENYRVDPQGLATVWWQDFPDP